MGDLEKIVLLSILQADNSSCGMDILSGINKNLQRDLSVGAVYKTINRLHLKGWLTAVDLPSLKKKSSTVTHYSVTEEGKIALCKSMTDLLSLFTKSLDSSLGWGLWKDNLQNNAHGAETATC